MDAHEEKIWFDQALHKASWPAPSLDLHERIMDRIDDDPAFLPQSPMTMTAWIATAFLVAFCIGAIQNNVFFADSESDNTVSYYYSGAGIHWAKILGS